MPIEWITSVFHRILEILKKAGCLSGPFFLAVEGRDLCEEAFARRPDWTVRGLYTDAVLLPSGGAPVAVFPRNAVRGGNGCIEMSYLVGMADRIKASVLQEVGGWGPVKVP